MWAGRFDFPLVAETLVTAGNFALSCAIGFRRRAVLLWRALCQVPMQRLVFLDIKVGDVVAVKPPKEKAYLAKVLNVEGGARFSDPNFD